MLAVFEVELRNRDAIAAYNKDGGNSVCERSLGETSAQYIVAH